MRWIIEFISAHGIWGATFYILMVFFGFYLFNLLVHRNERLKNLILDAKKR